MEQLNLFEGQMKPISAAVARNDSMQYWSIIDELGDIVLESNRKVPRLYATRQRAEEKIEQLCKRGKWQVRLFKLILQ